MDKFQRIFISEAEELLQNLESTLLSFEQNRENEQSVKEVFRIMHTLKGGASMFGFDRLSELTHELETIYDKIREGELKPSDQSFDITLQATDHLKALLYDPELNDPATKSQHEQLMGKVKAFLEGHSSVVKEIPAKHTNTFYVSIEFYPTVFNNGTNPLYLIDDVTALGDSVVLPSLANAPLWPDVNPLACHTTFEVILVTDRQISDVQDVFIFAEGQCKVDVSLLASGDLLVQRSFQEWLKLKDILSPSLGFDAIREKILESGKEVTKQGDAAGEFLSKGKTENSIRVASEKLDEMMNIVSELVTMQARLSMLAGANVSPEIATLSEDLEKITRRLRDNAFSISLVPLDNITTRFQRLVRDLATDLGKEVRFTASGTETELDKSIMERITDPILHLIRNGLDHGIESPEIRENSGKPRQGTLHLEASQIGTKVYIKISDDGKGIQASKIREKAIAKGLIDESESLSEKEIFQLVFEPGFSTAERITDISGRGVGMDIVKRNIESLRGSVQIDSVAGEGTTVTIQLPLTLSITDGLLVRIGESDYIIPVQVIGKCYEINSSVLDERVTQRLTLDGELIPVFNLHAAFGVPFNKQGIIRVIKLRLQHHFAAITVDEILGEYQAVMKPLGEYYKHQEEFSGATILGNGSVALVLDIDKLLSSFDENEDGEDYQVN